MDQEISKGEKEQKEQKKQINENIQKKQDEYIQKLKQKGKEKEELVKKKE